MKYEFIKRPKRTLSTEPGQVEAEYSEAVTQLAMANMDYGQERVPRGIEVEENAIYFYCPIGDREALELNRMIRRLDVEMQYLQNRLKCGPVPIHIYVQSPGGSLFAGLSIYDTIKNSKTPVYTYAEGAVASAATLVVAAGEKGHRHIGKSSFMLVHQPQIEWAGKLDEFRDEIENQKELFSRLREIYLSETKFKKKELEDILEHELWLNAETCVKKGLVDKIE